jgi:hypothetical protein
MEYGGECYCSNNLIASASAPITDYAMPCNDNGSEYCGAGYRLRPYSFGNWTSSLSSSTSQSPSQSTNLPTLISSSIATLPTFMSSTTASTPTGPVVVGTAGAYTYVRCYANSTAARALTGTGAQGSMMTVEYCASVCAGLTYDC